MCSTTHLTTFGGIVSYPRKAEEVLVPTVFSPFALNDTFTLLSDFDPPPNMSVLLTISATASLNLLLLVTLGIWRGHRSRITRQRSGTMSEDEQSMHTCSQRI